MTRLLVGLGLLVLAAPAMAQDAVTAAAKEAVPEPETGEDVLGPDAWSYRTITDEMDGTVTRVAAIQSANTVDFDFPYQGEQRATLVLSPQPGYDGVIFSVEKGQLPCHDEMVEPIALEKLLGADPVPGCTVRVKFDDSGPYDVKATGVQDGANMLRLNPECCGLFTDLVKRIQEAETVKIEVRAYDEGRTIFTFNVAGFDKDRYEKK